MDVTLVGRFMNLPGNIVLVKLIEPFTSVLKNGINREQVLNIRIRTMPKGKEFTRNHFLTAFGKCERMGHTYTREFVLSGKIALGHSRQRTTDIGHMFQVLHITNLTTDPCDRLRRVKRDGTSPVRTGNREAFQTVRPYHVGSRDHRLVSGADRFRGNHYSQPFQQ